MQLVFASALFSISKAHNPFTSFENISENIPICFFAIG